jgi:hypothetical protein
VLLPLLFPNFWRWSESLPNMAGERGRIAWTCPGLDSNMSLIDYGKDLVRDDNDIEQRCSAKVATALTMKRAHRGQGCLAHRH